MKKTILLMVFLVIGILVFLGCSSNNPDFRDGQFGRGANMTEEQRQQMTEEMQQMAIEACSEKNEGDNCTLEMPRGGSRGPMRENTGVCKITKDNLVCTINRPMEQRRE